MACRLFSEIGIESLRPEQEGLAGRAVCQGHFVGHLVVDVLHLVVRHGQERAVQTAIVTQRTHTNLGAFALGDAIKDVLQTALSVLLDVLRTDKDGKLLGCRGLRLWKAEALVQALSYGGHADAERCGFFKAEVIRDVDLIGSVDESCDTVALLESLRDLWADLFNDSSIIASNTSPGGGEVVDLHEISRVQCHCLDFDNDIVISKLRNGRFDDLGISRSLNDDSVVFHGKMFEGDVTVLKDEMIRTVWLSFEFD
ncbi:hypothetical protein HG530_001441 [Fusarium avenaceum]|nr:hypothetical protein HG530_001441 [Fusarium avenaceum]